jgi:hypothetical protein
MTVLHIQGFAHIADASLELGDLTVLVGAQGTGKSLALQWLKTALDGKQIVGALRDAGQDVGKTGALIDLIFGVGMGSAWTDQSRVTLDDRVIKPANIGRQGDGRERLFFIPAHRAMLISDGWAAPFQKLTVETPVVARLFSQNLFDRFSARDSDRLFPLERKLKKEYRDVIDAAVFHGGTVGLHDVQHTKRLRLTHGASELPFMTWTAGQREFLPLLLGLYHLLPERKKIKEEAIDWVVIEEPEMGLHPQAIAAFMLLVLDLLWRRYRVILATHSPVVLSVVWMLRRLQETNAPWQLLCDAFGVAKSPGLRAVAEAALQKKLVVHLMAFDRDMRVRSKDISSLDPADDNDDVAGWGGLLGFTSRYAEIVALAANEANESQGASGKKRAPRRAS